MANTAQHQMSLPPLSALTQGIVNNRDDPHKTSPNVDVRDSGHWSMPSKHSSTVSSNPGLHHILNPDDSPKHRFSVGSGTTSSSARYPSSNFSGPSGLQFLNQAYPSRDSSEGTFLDSRRSSVDSTRVNATMASMHLSNPTSPYAQDNGSRTSLATDLQAQRGIPPVPHVPRLNGRPASRNGVRSIPKSIPKIAPPIMGPRGGGAPDPTASAPTKGFAWAFPDNPDEEMESPLSSRQGSIAASSMTTMDSNNYHVHSLQPRSVASLQSIDASGSGNYSRTPELRVTHKLAERKRRSEMKDLFGELNQILPNSPGGKSSKWEILTKAIDYINSINGTIERSRRESTQLRDELTNSRAAIDEARAYDAEMTAMYRELCRLDPKGNHVFGPKTHALNQADERSSSHLPAIQTNGQPSQQPPAQSWGQPASTQMQGIEYNSHGNAYERR